MRILTDQLNSHVEKIAKARNIPIHWWPSVDGGTDGAKQKYVQEKYTFNWIKRKSNTNFTATPLSILMTPMLSQRR
jgi:hypothetical protein